MSSSRCCLTRRRKAPYAAEWVKPNRLRQSRGRDVVGWQGRRVALPAATSATQASRRPPPIVADRDLAARSRALRLERVLRS